MANRFPLIFNSGAGQIQELAASDNLDLTSSNLVNAGILFTSSGSVTAPSLQIGSGTTYNPGLYSPGTDQLTISTNGTSRIVVDASGNVNIDSNTFYVDAANNRVGLGTSSPSELFHLSTTSVSDATLIRLDGGAGLRQRFFPSSGTGKYNWQIAAQSNVDNGFEITPSTASGGSTFSTPAVVVKNDGKVGIGTISPSGKLTVSGNAIGTTVALTDAATVATDLSLANYYTLTLGGNRTLGAPTNQTAGQSGVIVITQDGTGSRTLAYNSVWKFPNGTVPTLTTTASAVDVLAYYVESGTRITARLLSDVK